jgi:hypothetical protein
MLSTVVCTGLSSILPDRRSVDAIVNTVLSVAPREISPGALRVFSERERIFMFLVENRSSLCSGKTS